MDATRLFARFGNQPVLEILVKLECHHLIGGTASGRSF
jgi:hypothetical protein